MSRVGKSPVLVPKGITAQVKASAVHIKGPKGEMTVQVPPDVSVSQDGDKLLVVRSAETDAIRARHGLAQRLLQNAVRGVSEGFVRELEIVGIGYRASKQADKLVLSVGYTRPAEISIPKGIEVGIESNVRIVLKGADRHKLGQLAADIRAVRPPEVYQGKGIRYFGERVRKKAGKSAAGSAAGGGAAGGK